MNIVFPKRNEYDVLYEIVYFYYILCKRKISISMETIKSPIKTIMGKKFPKGQIFDI